MSLTVVLCAIEKNRRSVTNSLFIDFELSFGINYTKQITPSKLNNFTITKMYD